MPGPAAILRDIHRLRRHAKDLQTELDRLPRQLKAQQNKVARQEELAKEAHDVLKRLKVQLLEKESQLKQKQQQVAKHEKQRNEATSKKELDALNSEIAAERTKCVEIEDDILNTMLTIEEQTAKLPEADQTVKSAKAEVAEFEKNAEVRQAGLKEQLQHAQKAIQEVEASLPDDVRPAYQRLVAVRGEDALSAVENRTCVACYTEITAQNYNDLVREQYVACKSCGRVLYLPA